MPPPISGMPVGDLSSAIAIQKAAERSAHFIASGTALFAYDWAITLSDEIRYIWQSNFTLVKMLFLVNRYLTLLVLIIMTLGASGISANSVLVISASAGGLTGVLFIVWNLVLAIRVHALWSLKPQMKYIIAACWIISSVCSLTLNIRNIIWMNPHETAIIDLKTCVPGALPDHVYIMWVPGICYETVIFVMAMTKLLAMNMRSSCGLGVLLLRDGVLHYVTLTTARVANMVIYIMGNPHTIYTVLFVTVGLGSTMVSRMVLNLRGWNQSEEENDRMVGMADFAARVHFPSRQEKFDRGVSVWIDRPRHQPRFWGGADPSNRSRGRDPQTQPERRQGVSMQTEVVTIIDSPDPFVVNDLSREPPREKTSVHL